MTAVCVDFDGVLHRYSPGWEQRLPLDDPPLPGAIEALAEMATRGWKLVVCSARSNPVHMRVWLDCWGAPWCTVSNAKPSAAAYIDDRAVVFEGDWAQALADAQQLIDTGPWTQRGEAP